MLPAGMLAVGMKSWTGPTWVCGKNVIGDTIREE